MACRRTRHTPRNFFQTSFHNLRNLRATSASSCRNLLINFTKLRWFHSTCHNKSRVFPISLAFQFFASAVAPLRSSPLPSLPPLRASVLCDPYARSYSRSYSLVPTRTLSSRRFIRLTDVRRERAELFDRRRAQRVREFGPPFRPQLRLIMAHHRQQVRVQLAVAHALPAGDRVHHWR